MVFDFCSFNIRGLHNKLSFFKDFVNNNQLGLVAVLETRVKEGNAQSLSSSIHRRFHWLFNYQHHYNGRIWLGWDPVFWTVRHLSSSSQHISCLVSRISDQVSFLLTVVYAFNATVDRRALWSDLELFNSQFVDCDSGKEWCIVGDFNTYLSDAESSGPPPRDHRKISDFRDCLNTLGVTDLQYTGEFYTWRDCSLHQPLLRKLDRVLVNDQWLLRFDMSRAQFLPRGLSDHNPAAVCLGLPRERIFKPFQIFQHLLDHPQFSEIVSDAWTDSVHGSPWYVLTTKLKRVKEGLKSLNGSFGNLHNKVNLSRQALLDFQSLMVSPIINLLFLKK